MDNYELITDGFIDYILSEAKVFSASGVIVEDGHSVNGGHRFLKISRDDSKREEKISSKITEFRNDICSFANAEGGYIIYGISDEQGTAAELVGVEVENPDRFELDLRNKLTPILPKVPQ